MKTVPFYRISTPKAPFYTEKGGADDRYIIPVENYKSMNIEQYAQLLKLKNESLQDCGVFFIDEHTSMVYSVIENNIDAGTNAQVSELESNNECKNEFNNDESPLLTLGSSQKLF